MKVVISEITTTDLLITLLLWYFMNKQKTEVLPLSRTILILRGMNPVKYDTIAGLGRG